MSIGHIKGRIHPVYRNIYCASGVVHLIDTVLAIPSRNAYQEIASRPELTILKSLIDQSSYATLLNQPVGLFNYALITSPYNQQGYLPGLQPVQRSMSQQQQSAKNKKSVLASVTAEPSLVVEEQQPATEVLMNENETEQQQTSTPADDPISSRLVKRQLGVAPTPPPYYNNPGSGVGGGNYNQYGYAGQQVLTILAPVDSAFAALTGLVQGNQSAIDAILAQHIIVSPQNVPYYTEHDQFLFQNGQTYGTVAQGLSLSAHVQLDPKTNINSSCLCLKLRAYE